MKFIEEIWKPVGGFKWRYSTGKGSDINVSK